MIKNIIFDFGGVIYDIDHQRTKNAFRELGLSNFDQLYGHHIQTKLFEDFEIGKISAQDFRAALKIHLPNSSDEQINMAWNAILLGFNYSRFQLLEKIKQHYSLFLLSNTNIIHYNHYFGELEKENKLEQFNSFFKKLYFSHQIAMRKPEKEIYNFVLTDSELKPEETVFIDDYNINIEAANACGLNGLLLSPEKDLFSLFYSDGKLI